MSGSHFDLVAMRFMFTCSYCSKKMAVEDQTVILLCFVVSLALEETDMSEGIGL